MGVPPERRAPARILAVVPRRPPDKPSGRPRARAPLLRGPLALREAHARAPAHTMSRACLCWVRGTAQANQMRPAGMVSSQTHSLHDCFSTRHVEGDFVQASYSSNLFDIFTHYRVVGAEYRAESTNH